MLIYRFPGQAVVSLNGSFIQVQDSYLQGFIISNFNNKFTYVFQESIETEDQVELIAPFVISPSEYLIQAKEIVSHLKHSSLEKIVYSRVKSEPLSISSKTLFNRLATAYPTAFVYHFRDACLGEWIGASPEILVRGKEGHFESMALAGTKKADETTDWGEKEIEEQAFVSRFLAELLQHHGVSALTSDGPKTVIAGPLAHLRTDFSWLTDSNKAWQIAKDLHPTPAVSGTPVQEATAWILQNEKHERSFYAGMIGKLHPDEMNIYVNLRCAQIIGDRLFLYLGGGFTADSDPEKEWEETENKSKTLLDLL